MGLIARDPTLRNMPGGYARFCELARSGHRAQAMRFDCSNGDVSRFAARFRVARSFSGISLDGYSDETVHGYDALFRVFLAWSAFERFLGILGEDPKTIMPRLRPYGPKRHLDAIRKLDRNRRFLGDMGVNN